MTFLTLRRLLYKNQHKTCFEIMIVFLKNSAKLRSQNLLTILLLGLLMFIRVCDNYRVQNFCISLVEVAALTIAVHTIDDMLCTRAQSLMRLYSLCMNLIYHSEWEQSLPPKIQLETKVYQKTQPDSQVETLCQLKVGEIEG